MSLFCYIETMGNLYVVATPIGNLEDISFRALKILKEVDLILCEDTRVTRKLLARYQIATSVISYHQHSRLSKMEYIFSQLANGKSLALVSDAGTPTISDPGAKLIDYLLKQMPDLSVFAVPGPSAIIAALSISGVPADKFLFLGFPPLKNKRNKFFEEIVNAKYTVVFYESPHRILRTLNDLSLFLDKIPGERSVMVCKELTKKFENIYRGDVKNIIEQLSKSKIKGEFVVIIS